MGVGKTPSVVWRLGDWTTGFRCSRFLIQMSEYLFIVVNPGRFSQRNNYQFQNSPSAIPFLVVIERRLYYGPVVAQKNPLTAIN